jgi:ubiquinone/menaquinone biosynthesis C-methylase UbiE
MNKAEFDKFADEYHAMHAASISVSGESPEYFAEYKIKDMARECRRARLCADAKVTRILDFGAGNGGSIPHVRRFFPQSELTCLDVSGRSLELAESRFAALARYVLFDGVQIPFDDQSFDLAYAACVFHHIDHEEHIALLRELRRVICPDGALFIFEHNPYNPVTVRVVNNCRFDENARLIRASEMQRRLIAAGFVTTSVKYRIFFPHALRALRPIERAIAWLPLGGQYYVFARR